MIQRARSTLLKLAVTVVLLALVLLRIDWPQFLGILSESRPQYVLLAAFLQLLARVLLGVWRWSLLTRQFQMGVPLFDLARFNLIGSFFGLFLPTGIGGDVVRAHYLGRQSGMGFSLAMTTVLLDRNVGFLALLILGSGSLVFLSEQFSDNSLSFWFVAMWGCFVAGNMLVFHPAVHRFFKRHSGKIGENFGSKIALITDGFNRLRKDKRALVTTLLLSLVIQGISVLIVWVAARGAFEPTPPLAIFLVLVPVISLTLMAPITINGIGLREILYLFLFAQIGVSEEAAVTLSLFHFAAILLAAAPGALVYSLYKKRQVLDLPQI